MAGDAVVPPLSWTARATMAWRAASANRLFQGGRLSSAVMVSGIWSISMPSQ